MTGYGIAVVAGLLILALAIPYVARIRHAEQKPLAAYLIFITVLGAVAALLYALFGTLADQMGLATALGHPVAASLFLALIFIPAVALATWQARKPPWRRGPPN